ncbi:defensin-like protein 2 [Phragmites australis]|uniref:defensin-like protein 2 n=1 Tax=Phragmites australis TaxID=29695 RepID=UPI002D78384A|nr:defensin-like protein 2 [Phragmites australis]
MELMKSRATVCALLLMLLLLSHGNGGGGGVGMAEARVCTGKSQHHSFPCISDRICSNQCIKQGGGWTAGYCHWRVCTCQKAC